MIPAYKKSAIINDVSHAFSLTPSPTSLHWVEKKIGARG